MNPIQCIHGDITKLEVDAIVNAANSSLMGGGGVDGAIHRAGGPQILKECMAIRLRQGGCPPGEAVITTGGNLKARYVIHTVGPIWSASDPDVDIILGNAYRNSNISTGVYRFPKQRAAEIAIDAVNVFLKKEGSLSSVVFCCFDEENEIIYRKLLS
jgi:O-acetyl-ADP-ribose deacetylase (regulator of RNase III)